MLIKSSEMPYWINGLQVMLYIFSANEYKESNKK